jgi:hypothetical protein
MASKFSEQNRTNQDAQTKIQPRSGRNLLNFVILRALQRRVRVITRTLPARSMPRANLWARGEMICIRRNIVSPFDSQVDDTAGPGHAGYLLRVPLKHTLPSELRSANTVNFPERNIPQTKDGKADRRGTLVHLPRSFFLVMAHENGGVSSFDSLCPELLDSIFEKVARDDPPALKQLGRVDTAFSDAAKKCHQALVLRPLKMQQQPQEAPHAFEVLSEELRSRPKITRLVVKRGAPTGLLGAVATVAWRSASIEERPSGPPLSAVQCAQRLSAARISMRSLDLTSSRFHLWEDIPSIVDFFPNLEDLRLRGQVCSQRLQMDDIRSNIKTLDVSLLSSTDTSTVFRRSVVFLSVVIRSVKGISSLAMTDEGPFQLYPGLPVD